MTPKVILRNIIMVMVIFAGLLACQNTSPPENLYINIKYHNVYEYNQIPEPLKSIEDVGNGIVFANEKDTLQVICSYQDTLGFNYHYPNVTNERPLFLLGDNHGNLWTVSENKDGKCKFIHQNPVAVRQWIKAFLSTGIAAVWIIFFFMIMTFSYFIYERKLNLNDIIKLFILAFFIGGCIGILPLL